MTAEEAWKIRKEDKVKGVNYGDMWDGLQAAIDEALLKQIPVKPIERCNSFFCKCGTVAGRFDSYCRNYGQKFALDWR